MGWDAVGTGNQQQSDRQQGAFMCTNVCAPVVTENRHSWVQCDAAGVAGKQERTGNVWNLMRRVRWGDWGSRQGACEQVSDPGVTHRVLGNQVLT